MMLTAIARPVRLQPHAWDRRQPRRILWVQPRETRRRRHQARTGFLSSVL